MKYDKPPHTIPESIALLKGRNLIIEDNRRAEKYINNIGYFRLSGYMFHLQSKDGKHDFVNGTNFNDIINLYQFDKKLRAIILEYLERIEICLRAKLTNKYSLQENDFFWFNNRELYADDEVFDNINKVIIDSYNDPREQFLKAFKTKYTGEKIPPSNMALEILSLGKLARLYKGLKNEKAKIEIAEEFNLPSVTLSSWLVYLANVRNICAHHSRLWNKKITADRPIFPSREKYKFKGENCNDSNTTMYGVISLINRLLASFNSKNSFIDKTEALLQEFNIDTSFMGFPSNWKEKANWKIE